MMCNGHRVSFGLVPSFRHWEEERREKEKKQNKTRWQQERMACVCTQQLRPFGPEIRRESRWLLFGSIKVALRHILAYYIAVFNRNSIHVWANSFFLFSPLCIRVSLTCCSSFSSLCVVVVVVVVVVFIPVFWRLAFLSSSLSFTCWRSLQTSNMTGRNGSNRLTTDL